MGLLKFKMLNLSVLGIVLCFLACNPRTEPIRKDYQGPALGTTFSIITYSEESVDISQGIDSVFAVFNQSMSTYIPDSDISKINAGDSTVVVDAMFREVFETSVAIWKSTDGYFDPTVGILVDAWGFGPGPAIVMDSVAVDSLLRFVGLEKVRLLPNNRVKKQFSSVRLDFNAIAKGYSIDRLAEMLDRKGILNYLIEVGGELRSRGINLDKQKAWNVGIDDPRIIDGRSIIRIIALSDLSMASSGNYRKFRIDPDTGQKFVHTIDPHTGYTRSSNILATSVLASACMDADAYATAFMAMPLEMSQQILNRNSELEGYIVYIDSLGQVQEFITPGFEKFLQ